MAKNVNNKKLKKRYCLFFRKMPYLKIGLSYNFYFGFKLTGALRLIWVSIQHLGQKLIDLATDEINDFAKKF